VEKPTAETTARFDRLLPDDVRCVRGQMFVRTFGQTLV
jgi:hypothetical protein